MDIEWKKYFDRIIVLHFPKYQDRLEKLKRELKRVDILDSGILDIHENISSPFLNILMKNIDCIPDMCGRPTSPQWASCAWGHYNICKIAQLHGYKRTLILEDDISFHKDKEFIVKVLDGIPYDSDLTILSHFGLIIDRNHLNRYIQQVNEYRANGILFIPFNSNSPSIGSAGTYAVSRDAATVLCGFYERHMQFADVLFQECDIPGRGERDEFERFVLSKLNKYYASELISIQNLHTSNSMSKNMLGSSWENIKQTSDSVYECIGVNVKDYIR